MTLVDVIKKNKITATGIGLAIGTTIGLLIWGNSKTPELEQRVTEKQDFYVKFGSPEKKYSDAEQTYGQGLAVIAALENENGKKMTDGDKLYFMSTFLDKNGQDGVSPNELSNYRTGNKIDGTARTWAKDLKPIETNKDGFEYTFKVDYDPTQLSRLNKIIEKHAAVRRVPNDDMWRYHTMKWAADNFSKDNYLNTDAVNKYEAHVSKVEGALK